MAHRLVITFCNASPYIFLYHNLLFQIYSSQSTIPRFVLTGVGQLSLVINQILVAKSQSLKI